LNFISAQEHVASPVFAVWVHGISGVCVLVHTVTMWFSPGVSIGPKLFSVTAKLFYCQQIGQILFRICMVIYTIRATESQLF